eukprot:CAMPEP_0179469154 /NCGR_PEP_ID=MMETSP0799-20121207/49921_1 /TAXON_ID=46947 /ORGANISM="Geminigera cryophila, Strain CCMP2564" /LENGTH=158 /DNA_ID=CAMNT_0021275555 /DNA_START=725 /DNA_END=1201 /DNA_ORIENTATION=-
MACGRPSAANASVMNTQASSYPNRPNSFVRPPPSYSSAPKQQEHCQQQQEHGPAGTFKVQIPHGSQPGQVMQVQVPQGYPQAGQMSTFRVPPGTTPGGFVFAPLPTDGGAAGGYNQGGYGNQSYQQGGYQNNRGGSTALAAGAGALGGFLIADALFDF